MSALGSGGGASVPEIRVASVTPAKIISWLNANYLLLTPEKHRRKVLREASGPFIPRIKIALIYPLFWVFLLSVDFDSAANRAPIMKPSRTLDNPNQNFGIRNAELFRRVKFCLLNLS